MSYDYTSPDYIEQQELLRERFGKQNEVILRNRRRFFQCVRILAATDPEHLNEMAEYIRCEKQRQARKSVKLLRGPIGSEFEAS